MRVSNDEIKDGAVFNGFDYDLQVWVKDGKVQRCGHPVDAGVEQGGGWCCDAMRYAGRLVKGIDGHEAR